MADVTDRQYEQSIEDLILSKGLTAPRVTPQDLDDSIAEESYFVFPGSTVTICLLTLKNGFTVIGESACASPENFDEQVGREVAFKEARNKLWPLLGFLLKDRLMREQA